jgi:tRNA(Ile2) C34 agmatinyltransferase TiaS
MNVEVSKEYLKELQELHRRASSLHNAWLGTPFGETDEKLIEIRLKRLMDWFRSDEEDEGVCPNCNGSGEGAYDGSTCHECGGRGE